FKLNPDGTGFTVVHGFNGAPGDGFSLNAGVIEGNDGVLYGATYAGGTFGSGTLFKLNKEGTGYGILHHFAGSPTDGANAVVTLLEGSDGLLYGVTPNGGSNSNGGIVFSIHKDGSNYTILHDFSLVSGDGKAPEGALVEASDGTLYGTTAGGGTDGN